MRISVQAGGRPRLLTALIFGGLFCSLGMGAAADPLPQTDAPEGNFWAENMAFAPSPYDPVARALKLGLTVEMVNRTIDLGLGNAEICDSPVDGTILNVGCQLLSLS